MANEGILDLCRRQIRIEESVKVLCTKRQFVRNSVRPTKRGKGQGKRNNAYWFKFESYKLDPELARRDEYKKFKKNTILDMQTRIDYSCREVVRVPIAPMLSFSAPLSESVSVKVLEINVPRLGVAHKFPYVLPTHFREFQEARYRLRAILCEEFDRQCLKQLK